MGAEEQNSSPTTWIGAAPWLISLGALLIALGVLSSFLVERHSFVSTRDFEFDFLGNMFLPIFAIGSLLAVAGVAIWARYASPRRVFLAGLMLGIGAFLIAKFGRINVHGWTGILLIVVVGAGGGSLLLMVAAAARAERE